MSVETWLQGIGANLQPEFIKALDIAHTVTNEIKSFEDSGVVDVAANLLGKVTGGLSVIVNDKIKAALPIIVTELGLASNCIGLGTADEIIKCAIAALQGKGSAFQGDFLDAINVHIAVAASDGKFTWDEVKAVSKAYYDAKKAA